MNATSRDCIISAELMSKKLIRLFGKLEDWHALV